jgi:hypothetical protein
VIAQRWRRGSNRGCIGLPVLLAALLALGVGLVAVPVLWLARETIKADAGEPSPDAAVNVYVQHLASGEEIGLGRIIASDRYDDLIEQWRMYRTDMERDRAPNKLDISDIAIRYSAEDRATVTAKVRGIWWSSDGTATSINGSRRTWAFEARRDRGGWRVWDARLPSWCGAHVRVEACR